MSPLPPSVHYSIINAFFFFIFRFLFISATYQLNYPIFSLVFFFHSHSFFFLSSVLKSQLTLFYSLLFTIINFCIFLCLSFPINSHPPFSFDNAIVLFLTFFNYALHPLPNEHIFETQPLNN